MGGVCEVAFYQNIKKMTLLEIFVLSKLNFLPHFAQVHPGS